MNDVTSEYLGGQASVSDQRRGKRIRKPQRRSDPERLPPQAMEAEQAALSCILIEPANWLGRSIEKFRGKEVFYDLRHQTIYRVLLEMHEKQEAIDVILLSQKLKDKGVLEEVGGLAYLSPLPDVVPSAANFDYYADQVWEKFLLREAVRSFHEGIETVHTFDKGSAEDLLLGEVRKREQGFRRTEAASARQNSKVK